MADFRISVNAKEIAAQFGQNVDQITQRLLDEVRRLSISTHAFVIQYAQERLDGWKRSHFFGKDNKNVRWTEVSNNIWVVEVDESVAWLEQGREKKFMDWLLNSPKAKTAKDGSKYAVIPFTQAKGGKSDNSNPQFASLVKQSLKQQGISLKKLEMNEDGKPKIGIVNKLNIKTPSSNDPGFFTMNGPKKLDWMSMPRSPEMARQIGLKPHSGIFKLANAVVTQREVKGKGGKAKFQKEVVTFRVISSKHEAEGRWYYPKVEALNSIPAAYDYAQREWSNILKSIESSFNNNVI